jgi:hypothetical protein
MARVTATEVKEIMDNCQVGDSIVEVFIDSGTLLIDKVYENDTVLGDDLLKSIELFFIAHMIASTLHRTTSEEKLGDAAVKYTGQWGKNLESTPYGQMVLQLDYTGQIASVGKMEARIIAIKSFE